MRLVLNLIDYEDKNKNLTALLDPLLVKGASEIWKIH